MPLPHAELNALLRWEHGFPHPRWDDVRAFVERRGVGPSHDLACEVERWWLGHVVAALGGDYTVYESDRAMLVSDEPPAAAQARLAFVGEATDLIADALDGVAAPVAPGSIGKVVVLMFSEEDDYYSYVAHYFQDGHYGLTGGVCVTEGECHVAVNGVGGESNATLAHELGHEYLAYRGLRPPLWLEEGVVQVLSRLVLATEWSRPDDHRRAEHHLFWQFHGLAPFWDGRSFSRQDEGQHLSYELAEWLVRAINAADPERFNAFLAAADPADAGESAAREHLGVSLVAYAGRLLGDGPWMPPEPAADAAAGGDDSHE